MSCSKAFKKLGVIGNPIRHSMSPDIHHMFASQQSDFTVEYSRYIATESSFVQTVRTFFSQDGQGLNVTLPFKEQAFQSVDTLSPVAKLVGAVNTLYMRSGQLVGDNTDGIGFIEDLKKQSSKLKLNGRWLIFGAGGAVRGILPQILDSNPESITLVNRSKEKALKLVQDISSWIPDDQAQLLFNVYSVEELAQQLDGFHQPYDLVINGASALWPSSLLEEAITSRVYQTLFKSAFFYDLNYGIRAKPFLEFFDPSDMAESSREASSFHAQSADGLGMLIEQAAQSFYLWCDYKPNTLTVKNYILQTNPLLESWSLPPFHRIEFSHLYPALQHLMDLKEQYHEGLLTTDQIKAFEISFEKVKAILYLFINVFANDAAQPVDAFERLWDQPLLKSNWPDSFKLLDIKNTVVSKPSNNTSLFDILYNHAFQNYGVVLVKDETLPVYHQDVDCIKVMLAADTLGYMYLDLYARDSKKQATCYDVVFFSPELPSIHKDGISVALVATIHSSLKANFDHDALDDKALQSITKLLQHVYSLIDYIKTMNSKSRV